MKRKLLKMQNMRSRSKFSRRPCPSKCGNLTMNGLEDILSILVDMSDFLFDYSTN